ncbi:MAG TPA: hypothetical protein DEH78_13045 [Solibacterales bacterium]|nr:hypothetical protein [Bryobacterales bacterium]
MRRGLFGVLAAGLALNHLGGAEDPLRFPKDAFTLESKTVRTSQGERKVTYRSYQHLTYVAKPVDKEYQSLDVNVPVEVDGVAVDATRAPILLRIPVGGYMAASNLGNGPAAGRRGGPEGPGGRRGPGGPGGPGMGAPRARNTDLALAAGYVVVVPGVRGRNNRAADGTYYGKAPAAIVDVKAAIRYLRYNAGILPGNTEWIVTTGVSAGGALSALAGASGDSRLYDAYFKEIGAAEASDRVFASADFCPIMDLEHADMAYEWMWGAVPGRGGQLQDQKLSQQLREDFAAYQSALKLKGRDGFGMLTAANYDRYLLQMYLYPAATRHLKALTEQQRREYLAANQWIQWTEEKGAAFTFTDFLKHVGRMKALPAFDDFEMRQPEPNVFGNRTTDSRHFTGFSLRHTTGDQKASVEAEVRQLVNLMNPMYFIGQNNKGMADHWWIRMGTSDAHTSLTVPVNLAASLENRGKNVSAQLYWDAGHGADEDAEDFIAWVGRITGFTGSK